MEQTCSKPKTIRLGIIGCGRIARRFVPETRAVDGILAEAVYNPHLESARQFARDFGIAEACDKQEDFAARVDAVYIASPHGSHYEYAKEFLKRGKHVLCEKPLCFRAEQAKELHVLADEQNRVLMEAVKTAYCPGFCALVELAGSGVIGEIRDVEAAFTRLTDRDTREYQDQQYGGSFTEFGSYALLPMLKLMGKGFCEVRFQSLCAENGVDEYTKAFFSYPNGFATAKTGLGVKSEGQLLISGTKGYILAPSPWWLTRQFEVCYEDPTRREKYEYPFEGQGLRYEISAFAAQIRGTLQDNDSVSRQTGLTAEETETMACVMEEFLRSRRK